jgi:hypothetical protein
LLLQLSSSAPAGLQIDWEAILRPTPEAFMANVKQWVPDKLAKEGMVRRFWRVKRTRFAELRRAYGSFCPHTHTHAIDMEQFASLPLVADTFPTLRSLIDVLHRRLQ